MLGIAGLGEMGRNCCRELPTHHYLGWPEKCSRRTLLDSLCYYTIPCSPVPRKQIVVESDVSPSPALTQARISNKSVLDSPIRSEYVTVSIGLVYRGTEHLYRELVIDTVVREY